MKNTKSKILGWQISLAKSLVKYIANNKHIPLTTAFNNWAKENGRQTFSVRNYYYKLVKLAKNNSQICEKLGINQNELVNVFSSKHFSDKEEIELLKAILPNDPPCSVRAVCEKLSNKNSELMIRYQNKYRNIITKQPNLTKQVMQELENKGIKTRNPYAKKEVDLGKIISMPRQQKGLKDSEIQALFAGLVRLVKINAEQEVSESLHRKTEYANETLKKALINLRKKELIIEELSIQNNKLSTDLKDTQLKLASSQTQSLNTLIKLQDIVKSQKMESLKNFINELNKQISGQATLPPSKN